LQVSEHVYIQSFPFVYPRHAFSTFDSNNDGTIDFDEFLLAMAMTSQGDLNNRLEFAFEM
jgi:Ca2+-binding EF-hand superfamily protein